MHYFNILIIFALISTLASFMLILYSIKHRNVDKSYFLFFLSMASYLYAFGYLLEITSSTLEAAFLAVRVQYLGLPFILPISYLFIRDIYGEKSYSNRQLLLIFLIPIITLFSMQAYPFLKIYYSHIEYISNGLIANCRVYPGPMYHIYSIFTYIIFLMILRLIIGKIKNSNPQRKKQSWILLAACMIPTLSSIPYVLSTAKLRFDPTPMANALSMLLLLYSIRFHNLINVIPIARNRIIDSMKDAFIVCDKDFNFLDANEAAKELFPELYSSIPGDFLAIASSLKDQTELKITKNNETHFYKLTETPLFQDNTVKGVCIILHDITEHENLLQRLRIQAAYDPLLNIYNRGTLFERAEDLIAAELSDEQAYSLLMIDLDLFKDVNDTYGHIVGDYVLQSVVSTIKSMFSDDIIGRYGGEEIAILLKNLSLQETCQLAERLRKRIEEEPIIYEDKEIKMTVSIGIAYSGLGEDQLFEDLLSRADVALYRAKNSGRNCIVAEAIEA